MSGDSFYIRVNMTMPEDAAGTLTVKCNDIVHVTDTHHSNDGSWWASHVHPCLLEDLMSGALPNYYRYTTPLFLKRLFIIRKTYTTYTVPSEYKMFLFVVLIFKRKALVFLLCFCLTYTSICVNSFFRAQRLLISALEDMTYPRKAQRKVRVNYFNFLHIWDLITI